MAITDLDEQILVRAHQAGDEHAFGQIVRSQNRALYAHAYSRLGSHEAAEDAVQDTLLRAYRALPSLDGDLRLRAWLHRILTNVCHDEGNRRRRDAGLIDRLEAQPEELAPDPVDEAVLHDTVRIMNGALAELPESYREALVLRYVDGLSFREVAEATGVTEENARARVHRGRLALHKVLARVSVMVAFVVPGLRRAQTATPDTAVATSTEPTMTLATQLTSHAMNIAPSISRVAEVAVSTSGAKTSLVATAMATAAAVVAPVAAYRVYDTTKSPERPPAAVAAPANDEGDDNVVDRSSAGSETLSRIDTTSNDVASSTIPPISTTTTEAPASAVRPFELSGGVGADDSADTPTTTTTAPPATEPPADAGTTIEATIDGAAFDVTGSRPDFEVSGPIATQGTSEPQSGTLAGRVYVADAVGGEASGELAMALSDGRHFRVRFRGTLDAEVAGDGATSWTISGAYSVPGGQELGLAETGTIHVTFHHVDAGQSSLTFDLQGQSTT